MDDQQLIDRIRTGKNDRALNNLYRHFPMVRKFIINNGGNASDAEDVFQESLIILIRKVNQPDFQLTAQLGTYLFGVCRLVWKDVLKKRQPHKAGDFMTGLSPVQEQDLLETAAIEARIELVERVLIELKDRCRDLLLLFYHGGLKLKDIAYKMGYSSEATAKNQKYKCLEHARDRLRDLKPFSSTL